MSVAPRKYLQRCLLAPHLVSPEPQVLPCPVPFALPAAVVAAAAIPLRPLRDPLVS